MDINHRDVSLPCVSIKAPATLIQRANEDTNTSSHVHCCPMHTRRYFDRNEKYMHEKYIFKCWLWRNKMHGGFYLYDIFQFDQKPQNDRNEKYIHQDIAKQRSQAEQGTKEERQPLYFSFRLYPFVDEGTWSTATFSSARFGPNYIFFHDAQTEFTHKSMQSMQHIIKLFSRSTIQHQNAKLIWHGRKQLLNSIAIQFFRIYAYTMTTGPRVLVACPRRARPRRAGLRQLSWRPLSWVCMNCYSNSY